MQNFMLYAKMYAILCIDRHSETVKDNKIKTQYFRVAFFINKVLYRRLLIIVVNSQPGETILNCT